MPVTLTPIDYAVCGLVLLMLLAVAVWTGRGQHTSGNFLLAGQAMRWWPLGLSLAVAGLTAFYYCAIPGDAYTVGMKYLLVPVVIWVALPVVIWCVIPLYYGLELESVYEYLELRYDLTTRTTACALFCLWQLPWLACVLVLPCKALYLSAGMNVPVAIVVVTGGTAATLVVFMGGMRGVVWTDVVQLALMAAALFLVIGAIWANLDHPGRVWEVAEELGRNTVIDVSWDWSATWPLWSAVPYLALVSMFFLVADQVTVQRLLAAADDREMQRSFVVGCVLVCLLVPLVMYTGLGLLAVYHDNAYTELRPNWIVNSARDPQTGRPMIGPETVIDAGTIGPLVAQGAILDPNTDRPLVDTEHLIDVQGRVNIDRLSTRERTGERRLQAGREELFGRFVGRHVRMGLAGLVLAALVAAALATVDSGITALTTLAMIDFHRRLGWGERWLAERQVKRPEDLDQSDEIHLARPVVLAIGTAITVLALVVAAVGNVLGLLLGLVNIFAGPLLAIFLLGLFTRCTTGLAALWALVLGTLASAWLTLGHHLAPYSATKWSWPWQGPLGTFWPLPLSVAMTLVIGYGLSFVLGRRKTPDELAGLVAGLGPWGIIAESDEDEVCWIESEYDTDDKQSQGPWR